MDPKEFFKNGYPQETITYHIEFVPETESMIVIKRNNGVATCTAVFQYNSVSMMNKEMLIEIPVSESDVVTMTFKVLPFGDYSLMSDPWEHTKMDFNDNIWASLLLLLAKNAPNNFCNTIEEP